MRSILYAILCMCLFGCATPLSSCFAGNDGWSVVQEDCRGGTCLNRLLPMRETIVVAMADTNPVIPSSPSDQPVVQSACVSQPVQVQGDTCGRFVGRQKWLHRPLLRRRCR